MHLENNLIKQVGISSNDTTWTYSYNDANRMTSAVETVTSTGAVEETATYVYDVLGNLLSGDSDHGWNHDGEAGSPTRRTARCTRTSTAGTIQTRYVSGVGGPDTWLARG